MNKQHSRFFYVMLALFLIICELALVFFSGPKPLEYIDEVKARFPVEESSESDVESESSDAKESHNESKKENESKESSQEEPENPDADIKTVMKLSSAEEDLYIVISAANGETAMAEFSLVITYPNGSKKSFTTNSHGVLYLTDLPAGTYGVSAKGSGRYLTPSSAKCSVKAKPVRKKIENVISEYNILSDDETGNDDNAAIKEDTEIFNVEEIDDTYDYNDFYVLTYKTGPNGYLLYRGTDTESTIKPCVNPDTNELDHGTTFMEIDGIEQEVDVILFYPDGSPVDEYEINLELRADAKFGFKEENGKTYYYTAQGERVTGFKKIGNKYYYFNQNGVKASMLGIDVSSYQNIKNWKALKDVGVDFVLIRLGGRGYSSGEPYYDGKAKQYLAGAKEAGLKIGAYFYTSAIDTEEAIEEASLALEILNGMELDLPIYFDTESSGTSYGRADKLSASQRTKIALAFCEVIESEGYKAGVYSGYYYYLNNLNYSALTDYNIWLAHYTKNYAMTGFPRHYDVWQFSDRVTLSAYGGWLDMDVIF